jgi:nucleoside-diphosphate-sugar epimerase
MRVLVAQDRGYIGTVPVPVFRRAGHEASGLDRRHYRVDFARPRQTFPELRLGMSVADGIQELVAAYAAHGLTVEEFASSRFTRLERILELLDAGVIDDLLRLQLATTSAEGAA